MRKTKEILVSVIVPVYNAENYIKECADSLVNQTLQNIEIIFINDGSKDKSLDILKEYSKKYKSKIRIISTKNNGIGITRNTGLIEAKGEYIYFVDSDDYIALDCLDKMYKIAEEEKADLVISDMYRIYNDKDIKETEKITFNNGSLIDNKNQLIQIPLGPCGKLFKKDIITTKFAEKLKYEDVPFVASAIKNSKNTVKYNEFLYYYRIHKNSETTSMDKRVFDIIEILKITNSLFSKNKELKEELEYLNIKLLSRYNLQQKYQNKKADAIKFLDMSFHHLENYFPNWKKNKYLKKRNVLKRIIETHKFLIKCYWKM